MLLLQEFYWHLPFLQNESTTEISPLEKLEENYTYLVNYFIMPIFALANTNIQFKSGMIEGLFSNFGYGIILGLVLGKGRNQSFSFIAIKLKLSDLPKKTIGLK